MHKTRLFLLDARKPHPPTAFEAYGLLAERLRSGLRFHEPMSAKASQGSMTGVIYSDPERTRRCKQSWRAVRCADRAGTTARKSRTYGCPYRSPIPCRFIGGEILVAIQSRERTTQECRQPIAVRLQASRSLRRSARTAFSSPPSERRADLERPAAGRPPAAASPGDPSSSPAATRGFAVDLTRVLA
jgi:hypothetical protein